jgi:hypothetical protein
LNPRLEDKPMFLLLYSARTPYPPMVKGDVLPSKRFTTLSAVSLLVLGLEEKGIFCIASVNSPNSPRATTSWVLRDT